jgi:hypothetical protein
VTRKTHRPAVTRKASQAPSQIHDKPTRKSAQAVASLCQRLALEESADELEESPAGDEYDETQDSDVALTTSNTDTIAKKVTDVMNVRTGKLAKKSRAKAKQPVEVRDLDDNDSSAEEPEGKCIP